MFVPSKKSKLRIFPNHYFYKEILDKLINSDKDNEFKRQYAKVIELKSIFSYLKYKKVN